ncbi:MAG: tannase/feruloyl esterase family alpha/beta hydrolase [Caulobacteraceae bacterium]
MGAPAHALGPWVAAALAVVMVFALAPGRADAGTVKAATDANLSSQMACADLAKQDFTSLPEAPSTILSAVITPAAAGAPEYCDVKGYVLPQIQFELRLPTHTWNGRYFQVGCGGFCGVVNIQNCGRCPRSELRRGRRQHGARRRHAARSARADSQDLRRDYGRRSTHATA